MRSNPPRCLGPPTLTPEILGLTISNFLQMPIYLLSLPHLPRDLFLGSLFEKSLLSDRPLNYRSWSLRSSLIAARLDLTVCRCKTHNVCPGQSLYCVRQSQYLIVNRYLTPNRCVVCRTKKVKCSGTFPCTYCLKRRLECSPPKKAQKRLYSVEYITPLVYLWYLCVSLLTIIYC